MERASAEAVDGPVLSVRSLAKRYGERQALRDVSFDVGPGELVAVVGPNGAGKTTLLSIVAGAQRASSGMVAARRARRREPDRLGAAAGGAVLEAHGAREPAIVRATGGRRRRRRAVARMLEQTGLGPRADERVQRLSGGNRQRVNVALGLLADPQVLALDEPCSALDPGQRARLWQFVGELAARGTSVLFSTHHLGEVRRYASRAIVLADGEVLFDGAPAGLWRLRGSGSGDDLEGAFLRLLGRARAFLTGLRAARRAGLGTTPPWSRTVGRVNGIQPPGRAGLRFGIQFATVPAATAVTGPSVRAGLSSPGAGCDETRARGMKALLVKDLLILRRSRLMVALLVIYPVAIALLIGLAISRGPQAERGDRRRDPAGADDAVGSEHVPWDVCGGAVQPGAVCQPPREHRRSPR